MNKKAFLIVLCITGIYLFSTTRSTLWDRDEPRFTRAVVEMLESGNYLVPTFNEEIWPDKPPLLYWVMSIPVRLLGPTEFACRFFGVIGSALACILTFFIGQRLLGRKAGIWAMVILASTLLMLIVGTAATSDAVLLPFNIAVMAIFALSIGSKMRISHVVAIGCILGLAMLTKGPIGLMPMPAIAAILWFDRKRRTNFWRDGLLIGVSLAIGFLIFIAWAIPANISTDGEFLRVFVGRHIITRALKPMENHGGNFLLYLPYYLPVIIVGFFPWTLHLPGAISAVIGGRIGGKNGRLFLLSWIVPAFVIMSLAATKLPHYILFIWPAIALAVAGIITAERDSLTVRDKIWLRRGTWFFGSIAIPMGLGLLIGPWFLHMPGLYWSGTMAGVILLIMAVFAIRYQETNRPQLSTKVLLVCMLVFEVPVLFGILPAIERIKISPEIATAVNAETDKNVPVAAYKYREPTLNFYIGRKIESLGSQEEVAAWAKRTGAGVLIIPQSKLDEVQQNYGDLGLNKIASKNGYNYSKGKTLEVAALIRKIDKLNSD